ncbi:hypothetical protein ACWEPH_03625 [Nocardia beijingensis]
MIRAAEVLGFGLKIENVLIPAEDGGYSLEWIVTRDKDVPAYEEWEAAMRLPAIVAITSA